MRDQSNSLHCCMGFDFLYGKRSVNVGESEESRPPVMSRN
jgi:hypothetical protein